MLSAGTMVQWVSVWYLKHEDLNAILGEDQGLATSRDPETAGSPGHAGHQWSPQAQMPSSLIDPVSRE